MLFFLLVAQAVVSTDFWAYQAINEQVTSEFYRGAICCGCRFCYTER